MKFEKGKITQLPLFLRNQQELDLDNFGVVSAPKGFGKSNMALYIIFQYLLLFGMKCRNCQHTWVCTKHVLTQKANLDKTERCPRCKTRTSMGMTWDDIGVREIAKYIAYTADDIYKKMRTLEDFSPLCPDEAVNFAMGEDWMFSSNKKVKRLFAQCRTKHLIIFMNIPKFSWVQSKYRDDMATAWYRILYRGICIMLIPDLGEVQDSWHLKEFEKLLGSYNVLTPKDQLKEKINKLRMKHPCFYDSFHVPKLPDRIYQIYKKVRDHYVYKDESQELHTGQLHKLMAYNLRYRWKALIVESKGRKYPSSRMIADHIMYHPVKKKPAISEQVIKNNVTAMKKLFKENVE